MTESELIEAFLVFAGACGVVLTEQVEHYDVGKDGRPLYSHSTRYEPLRPWGARALVEKFCRGRAAAHAAETDLAAGGNG